MDTVEDRLRVRGERAVSWDEHRDGTDGLGHSGDPVDRRLWRRQILQLSECPFSVGGSAADFSGVGRPVAGCTQPVEQCSWLWPCAAPQLAPQPARPRRMRVEHHDWHAVRADWLKANGLKGALTELRAMVWPHMSRRLVQDPDASIGTPRRAQYRALPQPMSLFNT
jgi:hypothetical protein